MSETYINNLMTYSSKRAFTNMFSVQVVPPDGCTAQDQASKFHYLAEKVDFGDGFTFTAETIAGVGQQFLKKADRPKTITIDFKETSKFEVLAAFKIWMNFIYSFSGRYFTSNNPNGTITLHIDSLDSDTATREFDGMNFGGSIVLSDAYPTNIKYPSFNWADAKPLVTSVTFVYTEIVFNFPGAI
jgi:hypothetical protein